MPGGYEQNPLQYSASALPPRFDITDMPLDLNVLRDSPIACASNFQFFSAFHMRSSYGSIAVGCRR